MVIIFSSQVHTSIALKVQAVPNSSSIRWFVGKKSIKLKAFELQKVHFCNLNYGTLN